jgi:hypothetical protein
VSAWLADGLFYSEQSVFVNNWKGHQPTKCRCSIHMIYFHVCTRQSHCSPAQKQIFQKKVSASNINEPLVLDEPFSGKLTFRVWASRGHTVIFLKVPPMQHLFREVVFINDWNWIYIIGAVFGEKAVFCWGGGEGKPMKALTGHQHVMGNLLNTEYE